MANPYVKPPYRYACTLSWGGDEPTAELEVECSYSVAWGSSESGRFGPPEDYDPGSGDVVEDIKILTVGGEPWPVDISYGFQTDAQSHEMLAIMYFANPASWAITNPLKGFAYVRPVRPALSR